MRAILIAASLVLLGCGDNNKPSVPGDATPRPDTAVTPLAPCLDRPTDLPRPPTGQLPCELLPPGLAVQP